MNHEKILSLSEQAISRIPAGLAPDKWIEIYNEKIVELTVKECALIAGLMEHKGRHNIGAALLDRFGVEE